MGNGFAIFGFAPPTVAQDPALLMEAMETEALFPRRDLGAQLSLILAGRGSRSSRSQGARGGGPLRGGDSGGGNRGRRNTLLPFFHLSRMYFEPSPNPPQSHKLFDRRLLEVVHRRLGRNITDAVLVIGKYPVDGKQMLLAMNRRVRNALSDLAQHEDPWQRFVELTALTQGTINDFTYGQPQGEGFPLVRISGVSGEATSIREYRFYQREGGPILVTFRSEALARRIRNRFFITDPRLRQDFLEMERQLDQVAFKELRLFVDTLYREVTAPSQTDTFINFFQGFALMLEAQNSERYPTKFFDALWRLIYQVRVARQLQWRGEVPTVEESYREVRRFLPASATSP